MSLLKYLALLTLFLCCNQSHDNIDPISLGKCTCAPLVSSDSTDVSRHGTMRLALLGTRFASLEDLKSVIQIEYHQGRSKYSQNEFVCVHHRSGGKAVTSILRTGVSQGDFSKAKFGDSFWNRLSLLFRSPFAVANRKGLEKIYLLSRWDPGLFGQGDLAFFDLAKSSANNINTPQLAFINTRDSTEKGFVNSFNHITAQALITSFFSEELADLIADAHERHSFPALIAGKFTDAEIKDLDNGPVDNYVDMVNNEWGQEIGKQLKEKYKITQKTNWTPELLAAYLNDLQAYYSWAFQIGFVPFRPDNEILQRFSKKINTVMHEQY
jgi:hypothetical protein